jgi:plastocyanin
MASMPMAQPPGARGTGTVVRLHQKVVRVSIHNFAFGPARLEVSRGTRLIWTNTDSDPHTVTSDKGLWASDALDTGNQFARVFKQAGTFPYHCSIHPFMHGTIIVKK